MELIKNKVYYVFNKQYIFHDYCGEYLMFLEHWKDYDSFILLPVSLLFFVDQKKNVAQIVMKMDTLKKGDTDYYFMTEIFNGK